MTIDILGIYESKINGRNVKVLRDESNLRLGVLYINKKSVGRVPFYYTVNRMIQLEDKCYPVYKKAQ